MCIPVTDRKIEIIATKPPLESVVMVDGIVEPESIFCSPTPIAVPSYDMVICELGAKLFPVTRTPSPMLAVLVLREIAVVLEPTVNRAECVWVPSVAVTLCEPLAELGTLNVAVKPPIESEVIVDGVVARAVPSHVSVMVCFDENVVNVTELCAPVTDTVVPTGPLDGESVTAESV